MQGKIVLVNYWKCIWINNTIQPKIRNYFLNDRYEALQWRKLGVKVFYLLLIGIWNGGFSYELFGYIVCSVYTLQNWKQ